MEYLKNNMHYLVCITYRNTTNKAIIADEQHVFDGESMYENRINARLFYDAQNNEDAKSKTRKLIEMFLVLELESGVKNELILFNSMGYQNEENIQCEKSLLNSVAAERSIEKMKKLESTSTQNSFLGKLTSSL